MATWQYRIQRYDPAMARARLSRIDHVVADDFDAAVRAVSLLVAGMRAADPDRTYRVVHLLSHDYRGEDCSGGGRLFETAEELTARLAEGAAS